MIRPQRPRRMWGATARLAEQREGVWLRPDNVDLRPRPGDDPDLAGYAAVPVGDQEVLAASLWDLDGWARGAEALADRLVDGPTRGPDDLVPGFTLSAAVLRHLQADPLLPPVLLPPDWPGARLREVYSAWDRRYRAVLQAWGRSAAPA